MKFSRAVNSGITAVACTAQGIHVGNLCEWDVSDILNKYIIFLFYNKDMISLQNLNQKQSRGT